jgi:hypothetical protein
MTTLFGAVPFGISTEPLGITTVLRLVPAGPGVMLRFSAVFMSAPTWAKASLSSLD